MPVESAIGSHITEPTEGDSRNGRAVVEAFEAWCCGVIVSEKTLLYATDASYRFLAEADTLLNQTLLRILALLPVV